jgi:hypothetical protein
MAKRKRSTKRPQPQHQAKRQPSQHDKRSRLQCPNPDRQKTTRAKFPLVGAMQAAVACLQGVLDRRIAFRLAIIAAGMLLADGRCTASCWFAAAGVRDDWDQFYDCLVSLGKQSGKLATAVLWRVVLQFDPGSQGRILIALDDSPTKRYGRHVEGAGVHHHPTPGPADGEWLYGHVWVTLSWLAQHPRWGTIALPLRSLLYVREVDVPKLDEQRGWQFRTKHQLAAKLLRWCVSTLRSWGVQAKVWAVADGAYAARPFLDPAREAGVVVVSRLRKDARLWDPPPARQPGQRGRPRIYGGHRLSLAKRASQRRGWESITYNCRGVQVTRQYKTFLATSRLVRGAMRVVLVRDEPSQGWAAYFCTDPTAEVRDILEAVASRWAIEEQFHDVKEVGGAGEQQVRNVWSNIACWNLNQWMFTLVELCSWDQPQAALSDRSGRPWDNADRRPSHADRRRWIAHECLAQELFVVLGDHPNPKKFRQLAERLFDLCI